MAAVIISISFFISPTLTLSYANSFHSTLSSLSNQTLASNNTGAVILEGATLIDGTGELPKPNTTIIINGDRIVFASNNTVNIFDLNFSAANVINLTGKYIIPGLFDMHAHVANVRKDSYNQNESEYMLHMLLTHGITTIRNPGGPTEQSVALRENVSKGRIVGPQIFTAGQLLNTPQIPVPFVERQVQTEQEVRQEVRTQVAAGVDYVKLYVGLSPELVKAAIVVPDFAPQDNQDNGGLPTIKNQENVPPGGGVAEQPEDDGQEESSEGAETTGPLT
jgi:hypothetical protein